MYSMAAKYFKFNAVEKPRQYTIMQYTKSYVYNRHNSLSNYVIVGTTIIFRNNSRTQCDNIIALSLALNGEHTLIVNVFFIFYGRTHNFLKKFLKDSKFYANLKFTRRNLIKEASILAFSCI